QRDAPAQLGFRLAQRAPGRGKAAVLDHLGEVVQVVQVLHRAPHRSPDRTMRPLFAIYWEQCSKPIFAPTKGAAAPSTEQKDEEDQWPLQRTPPALGRRRLPGPLAVLLQHARSSAESVPAAGPCRPG